MRKNEIKVKEKKIINKKIIYIIFAFFELFIFSQKLDATDIVKDSVGFDKYISTINEYVQKSDSKDVIDISSLSSDLIAGKSINYQGILPKILAIFFKEGLNAIQGAVTIFIVIVLMAVLSNLETEKDSSIAKISYFVCFLVIAIINIKIFIDVLTMFKQLISVLTTIMKVVSPFLLTILIATGAVSSSTIIQPMLLFLASLVNSVIEYIVIPFLSISVAFLSLIHI